MFCEIHKTSLNRKIGGFIGQKNGTESTQRGTKNNILWTVTYEKKLTIYNVGYLEG